MFTGLVQSIGQLQHLSQYQLKITCPTIQDSVLIGIEPGDSIAVDGVCLTVEQILTKGFIAAASPETLDKSTLGKVSENGKVNLETSLRVGSKIGGHFVTGHVDGTGQLEKCRTDRRRLGNLLSSDQPQSCSLHRQQRQHRRQWHQPDSGRMQRLWRLVPERGDSSHLRRDKPTVPSARRSGESRRGLARQVCREVLPVRIEQQHSFLYRYSWRESWQGASKCQRRVQPRPVSGISS